MAELELRNSFYFWFVTVCLYHLLHNKIEFFRLSNNKQRKVYIPEDPFPHAQLVKDGRLRHCKALHAIPELRQPCVLFCGHPSLRFGDITHLLETWGPNANNSIIFTGWF